MTFDWRVIGAFCISYLKNYAQAYALITSRLLVAIFASNFPEAMVGAIAMKHGRQSGKNIFFIWAGAAVILTLTVMVGGLVKRLEGNTLAVVLSFATALGFVLSFALAY